MRHSACLTFILLAVLAMVDFAGCNSFGGTGFDAPPEGVSPVKAVFFLEVRGDPDGAVPLPLSGIRVPINRSGPVLREYDITNVSIGRTEHLGPCLIFQFRTDAARDLSRLSIQNQGYRLVLSLNGRLVGVTTITSPISNGVVVVIPEVDEKELPSIVDGINFVSTQFAKALH